MMMHNSSGSVMPDNGLDHIFLRNAYRKLGGVIFPGSWVPEHIAAPPFSLGLLPSLRLESLDTYASSLASRHDDSLHDERRWVVKRAIIHGAVSGVLRTFTRPKNGGAFEPVKSEHWNGEATFRRFENYKMNPDKPFTDRSDSNRHRWIFIGKSSLNAFKDRMVDVHLASFAESHRADPSYIHAAVIAAVSDLRNTAVPHKIQAVLDALEALGDLSTTSAAVRNHDVQKWVTRHRKGLTVSFRTIEKALALKLGKISV